MSLPPVLIGMVDYSKLYLLIKKVLTETRIGVEITADTTGLAKDSTLQSILSRLDVNLSTRASEATLSGIKAQTDKLTFDSNGNLLIGIAADTVGIAKDSTVAAIRDRLPSSLTSNGNFKIAILEDAVGIAKDSTVAAIRDRLPSSLTSNGNFRIAVVEDALGLARDSTVAAIRDRLPSSLTTNGNFKIAILEDAVGLAKDSTAQSILGQLDIKLSTLRSSLQPWRGTVTHDVSAATVDAGGSTSITKTGLNGWSALAVIVKASFDANATQGVRVYWLYSPDGTNYDSPEEAEIDGNYRDIGYDISGNFVAAGQTRQATIIVPLLAPNVKILVENRDSSYSVTVDVWTLPLR